MKNIEKSLQTCFFRGLYSADTYNFKRQQTKISGRYFRKELLFCTFFLFQIRYQTMYERSKTSKAIATNRSYNYLIKPSKNICQIKVSFKIKTDLHNIFCSRPLSTINNIKIIFPIFQAHRLGFFFDQSLVANMRNG